MTRAAHRAGPIADLRRHGEHAALDVAAVVLAGVDDVEPRRPAQHRAGHPQRRRRQRPGHRDPRADGREGERRAEVIVAQPREPLQQRVGGQEQQHGDRQDQRPRVAVPQEPRRRRDERRRGSRQDREIERRGQPPAGNGAAGGSRVQCVQPRVEQPIRRHRDRPRRHHADEDQQQHPRRRHPTGGEERAEQCEGQREDRMADLDVAGEQLDLLEDRFTTEARRHGGVLG